MFFSLSIQNIEDGTLVRVFGDHGLANQPSLWYHSKKNWANRPLCKHEAFSASHTWQQCLPPSINALQVRAQTIPVGTHPKKYHVIHYTNITKITECLLWNIFPGLCLLTALKSIRNLSSQHASLCSDDVGGGSFVLESRQRTRRKYIMYTTIPSSQG